MSKILENNGINITNIDSASFNNFCSGQRSGIIKGRFNECELTSPSSSIVKVDTGEIIIFGVRIIRNITEFTFSTMPSNPTRYAIIQEIIIDDNSSITERLFIQQANVPLVQENLYKNENGAGIYQAEFGRFTLAQNGIEDLVRTIDIITGSKSGGGGKINIGTVVTETLAEGLDAEVDIETVFNEEDNKYYTNFQFHIPKGDTGEQGPQGLQGIQGLTGNGITKVEKTSTSGLTDTYTITFTDSTTATFTVENGKGIVSVAKTNTSGLVDTYTITFNDGTSTTFTVTNGAKGDTGNGISSIEKSGTVGAVDTYIINFTNGTTTSFQITNGEVTLAQMNSAIQSAIYDSWGGSY